MTKAVREGMNALFVQLAAEAGRRLVLDAERITAAAGRCHDAFDRQ